MRITFYLLILSIVACDSAIEIQSPQPVSSHPVIAEKNPSEYQPLVLPSKPMRFNRTEGDQGDHAILSVPSIPVQGSRLTQIQQDHPVKDRKSSGIQKMRDTLTAIERHIESTKKSWTWFRSTGRVDILTECLPDLKSELKQQLSTKQHEIEATDNSLPKTSSSRQSKSGPPAPNPKKPLDETSSQKIIPPSIEPPSKPVEKFKETPVEEEEFTEEEFEETPVKPFESEYNAFRVEPHELIFIEVFNVDDVATVSINGQPIIRQKYFDANFQQYQINQYLRHGKNEIRLAVINDFQGYTWGFRLKKNSTTIWESIAGQKGIYGARDNDYTHGCMFDCTIVLFIKPVVSMVVS